LPHHSRWRRGGGWAAPLLALQTLLPLPNRAGAAMRRV
jgi:hypothetical protein